MLDMSDQCRSAAMLDRGHDLELIPARGGPVGRVSKSSSRSFSRTMGAEAQRAEVATESYDTASQAECTAHRLTGRNGRIAYFRGMNTQYFGLEILRTI